MDPGELLRTELHKNFPKFGTIRIPCTYQSMLSSSYTGGNVTKPIDSSHSVDIIFGSIKASLVDESTILLIDRVAIFPALSLPVVPKINDLIVDSSLREWEVKDVGTDPAGASHKLRVRPING